MKSHRLLWPHRAKVGCWSHSYLCTPAPRPSGRIGSRREAPSGPRRPAIRPVASRNSACSAPPGPPSVKNRPAWRHQARPASFQLPARPPSLHPGGKGLRVAELAASFLASFPSPTSPLVCYPAAPRRQVKYTGKYTHPAAPRRPAAMKSTPTAQMTAKSTIRHSLLHNYCVLVPQPPATHGKGCERLITDWTQSVISANQ
jgi:hypothetical protein